jgi:diguanylate cyclase (GGDEF)-like protein
MAVQTSSRNAQSAPKSHFLFLIIWGLLSVTATAILVGAYFFEARRDKDLLCENTRDILRLQKTMIAEDLSDMINDVLFVARHLESLEPWNTPKDRWVSTATTDMSLFADARQTYSQVRLIDANENEVVRIEYHHNRAAPVRPDALQHKEHRYYVQVSKQLDHGEVYISPMDLNVEQGQIETPYRPTIRFCTPIYTPDGEYFGLVVLNYRADLLRTLIGELATFSGSQTMIANAHGYWLMHPNEAMEWGWHIPGRESATLKNQIPDLWDASRLVKSGAVERPEGLYLYDTMTCTNVQASTMGPAEFCRLSGKMGLDDEDGFTWLLIHHIPRSTLVAARMRLSKTLLVVLIFFCLLLLPLAWILAQFIVRRRHRNELLRTQAFLDPVTQLANRHRFLEQLEQAFQMAKRFEDPFAVAFLDLDSFKQVNDRLGHAAGDTLLAEVGARLEGDLRTIDLVARLGGDEFTIILPKINEEARAEVIAEKLLHAIGQPIDLSGTTVTISPSIGIAFYDPKMQSSHDLLRRADTAMYAAKLAGKNTYRFWNPDLQEHSSDYTQDAIDLKPKR